MHDNYEEWIGRYFAGTASAEEIRILISEGLITEEDQLYASALQSEREKKLNWEFEDFKNILQKQGEEVLLHRNNWVRKTLVAAAIVGAMIITYFFWPQQKPAKEIANLPAATEPVHLNKTKVLDTTQPFIAKTAPVVKDKERSGEKGKPGLSTKKIRDTSVMPNTFIVFVNGRPIKNESEAIAITRESLTMISEDLSDAIDELKPISKIKIKL